MLTFTVGDTFLVRELWPEDLPVIERDITDFTARDIVPETVEELFTWAYVGQNPNPADASRRHVLLHANEDDDTQGMSQVAIRLQGFVRKINIRPLGNWNRSVYRQPISSLALTDT